MLWVCQRRGRCKEPNYTWTFSKQSLSLSQRKGRDSSLHKISVSKAWKSRQLTSISTREGGWSSSPHQFSINKACNSRQRTLGSKWAAAWNNADSSSQAVFWSKHLARLWQSYCLNTNTRAGCWWRNTRTTKTEIPLLLKLEFFFSFPFSLSACLVHC
jgi:hypothetical protein